MFDLNELKTYKEGNRLEAKRALGRDGQGELPRSVWETVSAFANTSGGVIVLGVTERKDDGGFVVHGIPKAGKVLDDFWNAALSEDKVSTRFMKDSDATVETVDGKDIVVIRVPWVDRFTRPVYIDDKIFGGTFRRTHTGDHQCKREEVLSMLRDSDTSSQDAAIAENARLEFINRETVHRYRMRFDQRNENHVWSSADDEAFLTERMDSMKAAWRAAYTTPEGFRSANSKNVDDRANAMLALSGLADESDYEQICAVLTSTCEASPFTEKYVLEALCVMSRVDLAVQRMLERYDPMLHDEWDTLWEQFNDNVGTYNHGWSAAPLYILSKYVVGVRPTAPGFARYELTLTEILDEYACSVYTPRGELRVEKAGDTVTLTAIDGEGTVILPNGETVSITEAGTYTMSLK